MALVFALFCGPLAACTAPDSGPSTSQAFCTFYEKVEQEEPTVDSAVLVKKDVVALANQTTVEGNDCNDSNAKVKLAGAVLAEGEEIDSELGVPDPEPIAAVTGGEIGAEEPVLDNLRLKTLSVEIGQSGIIVRGNVAVTLSGVTSTIGFVGTLQNLDNWSIGLSSSGLTIPGITSTPVVFNGMLKVTNGVPALTLTANASSAQIGDMKITGASINLSASPATGVSASVAGAIKVGPSTASGSVDVVFDRAGALVSANAEFDAHLVGTQAGGKKIDLEGTVSIVGNADETAVSFKGSGILGDLIIHEANGSLTLATNKATFIGVLDVTQGANYVRFNGSIVWDGISAYTPFLQLEAGGEISGTLNDGQTVTVAGSITTEVIAGQIRAVITGSFKVGTLSATGSAIMETTGATTALYVDAQLTNAGFATTLGGAIVITDGLAETLSLDASVQGQVNFGDVTLTGATLSIDSTYGSPLDLSFSGGIEVGDSTDLTGDIRASFGPNGGLISMEGTINGSLQLDNWGLLGFSGTVIANPEQVTLTGSGGISLINFPLGITFNGSFTSSLTEPTWSLNATGRLQIASLNIAQARLTLSQTAGMRSIRTGFYFSIIGISTYFEGDFYLKPEGGCTKVNITGGSFLAKPLLALVLPGVIGCPVYI